MTLLYGAGLVWFMDYRMILVGLVALALPATAGPGNEGAADEHAHGGVVGPDMFTNDTWSHTFNATGSFEYHCHPHPWMQASITVIEANESAPANHTIAILEPENFEEWSFGPVELTVRVGDTVTWVNQGQQMHKVAETTPEHADHIAAAGSTVASDGDGHGDHDHASSPSGGGLTAALLWAAGGLLAGVGVAQWLKRRAP